MTIATQTHRFTDESPIDGLCDTCGSSVQFHTQQSDGSAQSTPRPWRYEAGTKTIRSMPANYWLATMDSWDGALNHEANAAFIVQAVNNHEALVAALEQVRTWLIAPATDKDTLNEMREMVSNALATVQRDGVAKR